MHILTYSICNYKFQPYKNPMAQSSYSFVSLNAAHSTHAARKTTDLLALEAQRLSANSAKIWLTAETHVGKLSWIFWLIEQLFPDGLGRLWSNTSQVICFNGFRLRSYVCILYESYEYTIMKNMIIHVYCRYTSIDCILL